MGVRRFPPSPRGLLDRGAEELASLVRAGDVSAVELVRESLERLERGRELNAVRALLADDAVRNAREADRRSRRGCAAGALHGVPVAVKDNLDVAGVVTTAGTAALRDNVARRTAATVERLVEAGAIVVAKLHLAEWAIGATTHNPSFGPARNPWDLDRSAGGSSGGSAAAVAADMVPIALGTDTGGSLRVPAALTGTTTVRPTRGLVSRRGAVPVSWTLDTVGPIARRAEDVGLALDLIAGYDPADPGSRRRPVDAPPAGHRRGRRNIRVGVLGGEFRDRVAPGVLAAVDVATAQLAALGMTLGAAAVEGLTSAGAHAGRILLAEAAAVHRERLQSAPDGFAPDVLQRLRVGAAVTGSEYAVSREAGRVWRRSLEDALAGHDVLLAPACSTTAPLLDGCDPVAAGGELVRLSAALSLAGCPVVVVPCGVDEALPVALQLIGRPWCEGLLLSVASAFQAVTDWHLRGIDGSPERRPLDFVRDVK